MDGNLLKITCSNYQCSVRSMDPILSIIISYIKTSNKVDLTCLFFCKSGDADRYLR